MGRFAVDVLRSRVLAAMKHREHHSCGGPVVESSADSVFLFHSSGAGISEMVQPSYPLLRSCLEAGWLNVLIYAEAFVDVEVA